MFAHTLSHFLQMRSLLRVKLAAPACVVSMWTRVGGQTRAK
jgi:hypothetical protein